MKWMLLGLFKIGITGITDTFPKVNLEFKGGRREMREIKFRAWDTTKSRMVMQLDKLAISFDGNVCYLDAELNKRNDLIVMQYTGLKDKNGKEIYEGDIVLFSTSWNQTPDYKEQYGTKKVVGFEKGMFNHCRPLDTGSYDDIVEILGNIYKNPDLVEEEGK